MSAPDIEGRHYLISGRVQGVGFRFYAHRVAGRLGLVGWVKNLPDGRVEAYVAGPARKILEFRQKLETGPGGSIVRQIDEEETEPDPSWTEYEIRF